MKRIGNIFMDITSMNNLILAFRNVKKSKTTISGKKNIYHYELNLGENLLNLQYRLRNDLVKKVEYNIFEIFENKTRKIYAPSIESAIIQHAIYFYLRDFIDGKFIHHSYACRV